MATKTAKKKVTKKAVKAVNVDFSNSIEKIKGTAKTVNNEMLTTATEVLEDLRTNGEKIRETATATVKEAIENATVANGVKFVKATAKNINEYSLETAENMVEGALKGGKKWQGVAAKAVKNGLELNAKNQEIVFDTLDAVKAQLTVGAKRFSQLFKNN